MKSTHPHARRRCWRRSRPPARPRRPPSPPPAGYIYSTQLLGNLTAGLRRCRARRHVRRHRPQLHRQRRGHRPRQGVRRAAPRRAGVQLDQRLRLRRRRRRPLRHRQRRQRRPRHHHLVRRQHRRPDRRHGVRDPQRVDAPRGLSAKDLELLPANSDRVRRQRRRRRSGRRAGQQLGRRHQRRGAQDHRRPDVERRWSRASLSPAASPLDPANGNLFVAENLGLPNFDNADPPVHRRRRTGAARCRSPARASRSARSTCSSTPTAACSPRGNFGADVVSFDLADRHLDAVRQRPDLRLGHDHRSVHPPRADPLVDLQRRRRGQVAAPLHAHRSAWSPAAARRRATAPSSSTASQVVGKTADMRRRRAVRRRRRRERQLPVPGRPLLQRRRSRTSPTAATPTTSPRWRSPPSRRAPRSPPPPPPSPTRCRSAARRASSATAMRCRCTHRPRGKKDGKATLKVKSRTGDGRTDTDVVKLVCKPAPDRRNGARRVPTRHGSTAPALLTALLLVADRGRRRRIRSPTPSSTSPSATAAASAASSCPTSSSARRAAAAPCSSRSTWSRSATTASSRCASTCR